MISSRLWFFSNFKLLKCTISIRPSFNSKFSLVKDTKRTKKTCWVKEVFFFDPVLCVNGIVIDGRLFIYLLEKFPAGFREKREMKVFSPQNNIVSQSRSFLVFFKIQHLCEERKNGEQWNAKATEQSVSWVIHLNFFWKFCW